MIQGCQDKRFVLGWVWGERVKSVHFTLRLQTARGKLGKLTDAPMPDGRWEQQELG